MGEQERPSCECEDGVVKVMIKRGGGGRVEIIMRCLVLGDIVGNKALGGWREVGIEKKSRIYSYTLQPHYGEP